MLAAGRVEVRAQLAARLRSYCATLISSWVVPVGDRSERQTLTI
jgi:hypothetical protein